MYDVSDAQDQCDTNLQSIPTHTPALVQPDQVMHVEVSISNLWFLTLEYEQL